MCASTGWTCGLRKVWSCGPTGAISAGLAPFTERRGRHLPPDNDEETAGQREKLERPNSDASFNLKNKVLDGNSLAVQWLRLPAFTAKGMGSIADGELRSCKPHGWGGKNVARLLIYFWGLTQTSFLPLHPAWAPSGTMLLNQFIITTDSF